LKKILPLLLLLVYLNSFSQQSAFDIFAKSYAKINSAKNMEYQNFAKEKIDNKYIIDNSLVRVVRSPYKVYLFQHKEGGSEILYNSSVNKEKAIINPGEFPYINLNLSPYGTIMRNKAHHTIFDADLKYTYDVVNNTIQKKSPNNKLIYHGLVKIDNNTLYKIELINKDCKKYKYTVKANEDLVSIAKEYKIGDYKILELNPSISFYDDVKAGDIILIPNYYSKSIIMYIDIKTYLPYVIKVFDEYGLYESFKLKDLKININFSKDEFLESNPKYGF